MRIEFFIPGEPPRVIAQQKGVNRRTGKYYKPAELRDAEQKYLAYAHEVRPAKPMEGPIRLTVVFQFDAGERHTPGVPKTTKPDTDNMVKALKDSLTRAGIWKDDAQVWYETAAKIWARDPGIWVTVDDDQEEEKG